MSKQNSALSQPVYEYIQNMIMTKEVAPGEKIPENRISESFGISRTPVRDALRQLANDGLINIIPNRFAQVVEYSPEQILEIGTLRMLLDSMSIRLCLLYGNKSEFLNLRRIAIACEEAYIANNYAMRCKYDMNFHMELANISKNSLLIKFLKELNLRVQFIILHYPDTISNDKVYVSQHVQLVEALINHDEDEALRIIRSHLSMFYNLSDVYPENFFDFITGGPVKD